MAVYIIPSDRYSPALYFDPKVPLFKRWKDGAVGSAVALIHWRRHRELLHSLHSLGICLSDQEVARLRLRKTYVAGAVGGYFASVFTNPHAGRTDFHLSHSKVLALWSNVLIAGDAAMDENGLSLEESRELLGRVFRAICSGNDPAGLEELSRQVPPLTEPLPGRLPAAPNTQIYYQKRHALRLQNYTLGAAVKLGRAVARVVSLHTTSESYKLRFDVFVGRTADLIDGQLSSLEQQYLAESRDWEWYFALINQKASNAVLAPLELFMEVGASENGKSSQLQRCWLAINQLFFHIQVLDDMIDFDADTAAGLAGTLIYMLISQGRLARKIISLLSENCAVGRDSFIKTMTPERREGILAALVQSHLLLPFSHAWRECRARNQLDVAELHSMHADELSPRVLTDLIVYALGNSSADLQSSVKTLAGTCLRRHEDLMAAWRARDIKYIRYTVKESKVAFRVIDTISDERNMKDVEQTLRGIPIYELSTLAKILFEHNIHKYQRVSDYWRSV